MHWLMPLSYKDARTILKRFYSESWRRQTSGHSAHGDSIHKLDRKEPSPISELVIVPTKPSPSHWDSEYTGLPLCIPDYPSRDSIHKLDRKEYHHLPISERSHLHRIGIVNTPECPHARTSIPFTRLPTLCYTEEPGLAKRRGIHSHNLEDQERAGTL
jgi:hypothetical protein